MPTYQYACTACDERLEAVQSFSDAALTECPACGGRLRKVFSAVGVVFKGSGFYKNDSRESAKSGAQQAGDSGGEKAGGDKAAGDGGAPKKESSGDGAGKGATPAAPAAAASTGSGKGSGNGSGNGSGSGSGSSSGNGSKAAPAAAGKAN